MPQFDVATYSSQIFWLCASILFLIVFFKRYFIPRMEDIFQTRYLRVQDEKKKLDNLRMQIESLEKNKLEKIQTAQKTVADLIAQTKKDLEREKNQQIQKIDDEMQANLLEFQNQLKWKMQEVEQVYEKDIQEYVEVIKQKITAGDFYQKEIVSDS